ncbi:dihydrolipoyl dehydrogenase [Laribacter hongkongensis]|uniref:Dihydrolipoyl dehydrogenase n=1 Tax=Laribacter hongkongensis TaxID=168471 RepID=A0AAW5DCT0_9NEIS|nr:dihydrolipoyl dehydrogenase [Laribacter hongkongensis]MCG8994003.1 dihydrolipoyl dehydrogenase [Laribacter hongkongensis]MCG9009724.1 dihydrolipoyl dehydrogenase [Laribacter hongkongensis]MCG9023690.1 dihydrolipoyl dehydrogenase [Laribacter hongkongensis]MCG9025600.1 dihydrolipoyl dehydrogenase [Laribacter hongkongensis]MCG9046844.1 dihydrolipoyl dehydrogenase [Laribacter hongkongensis]
MSQQFDVVVIGGGPGGYVAAIRAAQLGFNTACVDSFKNPEGQPSLGGTCLNVGCIPSKALLQSSENLHAVQHDFAAHGISVSGASMDVGTMLKRKEGIIGKNAAGIAFLFKKNKVANVHGLATLKARQNEKWVIEVTDNGAVVDTLEATHVIIATGSRPRPLPGVAIDNRVVLDNAGALAMTGVPQRLGVIGSGVIGLEMGSVWKRLGAEVTVLEAMPAFLAAADQQIAKEAFKYLTKQTGLDIQLGVKIGDIKVADDSVSVAYEVGGEQKVAEFDRLIVSIGRVPNTDGLGAENVGLQVDERGFVVVDDNCHANLPNVWAIGDVVRGPMLAHKASEEGVAVAERIAGQKPHIDFGMIPWVIYTSPEIAWVGKTEEQLKAEGIEYKKGTSGFAANGRALGLGMAQGTVKVLACAKTDRILGVHIIGPFASELIAEAVVAMEFAASSEDIARIVHAHPSLSEVLHEACLAADKRALHG